MNTVTSKDRTKIAYDKQGQGRVVILVGGGLVDRSENMPLASELAKHFTVYNYDRRGRGKSSNTLPYAVEHEIEDIDALIMEAGGTAYLYGVSSGGALVLEAAAAGLAVDKLAVYELPYSIDDAALERWEEYVKNLTAALARNRRDDALALFMQVAGSSEEQIKGAKQSPFWSGGVDLAHTLAYDAAVLGDHGIPTARFTKINQPVLIVTGERIDPHMANQQPDFFGQAADAAVAAIPQAERITLKGQTHMADPKIIASMLVEFFKN